MGPSNEIRGSCPQLIPIQLRGFNHKMNAILEAKHAMTRVGLVMIVRDEASVIQRALTSAIPFITTWLIVDTGSTDRTQEIVRETLRGLSGELVERPWVDFGHNRSEALALCEGRMDWAIMLDADDNLAGKVPPAGFWESLPPALDGIAVSIRHTAIWHQRVQIFRMGRGWIYKGRLHEYPACTSRLSGGPQIGILTADTFMETRCEGFRSRNPQKYLDDARLLEADHAADPSDGRILFYLAQSYRDAGRKEEATRHYLRYVGLGEAAGSVHERYIALHNLIVLTESPTAKLTLAWQSIDLCPDRLEAPFTILETWRKQGWPVTAQVWALAKAVKNRHYDRTWMFVNPAIYEWALDNEIAVAASVRGDYRECYEASLRCATWAPEEAMREAARRNARVAHERILTERGT